MEAKITNQKILTFPPNFVRYKKCRDATQSFRLHRTSWRKGVFCFLTVKGFRQFHSSLTRLIHSSFAFFQQMGLLQHFRTLYHGKLQYVLYKIKGLSFEKVRTMLRFARYWWVKIMENNLRRTEFSFFFILNKRKQNTTSSFASTLVGSRIFGRHLRG